MGQHPTVRVKTDDKQIRVNRLIKDLEASGFEIYHYTHNTVRVHGSTVNHRMVEVLSNYKNFSVNTVRGTWCTYVNIKFH